MIEEFQPRHWLAALMLAVVLHALVMLRYAPPASPARAVDAGAGAITIALAPPPAAPKAAAEPAPETALPEPRPLESPVKNPVPESLPEREPVPEPEQETETRTDTSEQAADNEVSEAAEVSDRVQAGSTGGIQDATPDYRTRVSAWLERHKEYPMSARRKGEEGMAMVSFTFERDGRITDYRLLRRTGHDSLDRAIEKMMERASPLPRIPDDIAQDRMTWTLPVYFRLR